MSMASRDSPRVATKPPRPRLSAATEFPAPGHQTSFLD
jgi:hypothetical protein